MRRVILAGLTLVLAACQDALPTAPVAAEAEPLAGYGAPVDKTVQQVPVSLVTTGPCLLETLVVQGTLHVTTTVWAAGDRLRIKSHLNGNLAAVGLTTGLPYRYQQVTNTDLELDTSTGASESDQVFLFRVLSKGPSADYTLMLAGTYRYDAVNGGTFEPRRVAAVCR